MILDNNLLNEYAAMKAEVKDLRRRISSLMHEMNQMFPRRSIAYTDENVKKRIQRFLAAC